MLSDTRFEEATGGPVGYCGPVATKCKRVLADDSLRARVNSFGGTAYTSSSAFAGIVATGPAY